MVLFLESEKQLELEREQIKIIENLNQEIAQIKREKEKYLQSLNAIIDENSEVLFYYGFVFLEKRKHVFFPSKASSKTDHLGSRIKLEKKKMRGRIALFQNSL